ncbi:MAG TPA: hypothetical protein VLJ21_02580 [Candidatus Binatia bacterium]|nr:hypothetical protein [Candidatus Binatia bacterium]
MPDDDIRKAIAEARRLEAEDIPTDSEIAEQYERDMAKATEAAKLLKRIREPSSRRKKSAKSAKK